MCDIWESSTPRSGLSSSASSSYHLPLGLPALEGLGLVTNQTSALSAPSEGTQHFVQSPELRRDTALPESDDRPRHRLSRAERRRQWTLATMYTPTPAAHIHTSRLILSVSLLAQVRASDNPGRWTAH